MEKTKKKFNWVNVLIIILIIAGVLVALNRDKIFSSDTVSKIITGKNDIIMTAKSSSIPLEVAKSFKVGDKAVANGKILDGEITEVRYEPAKLFEVKDGKVEFVESKDLYDLYVTFKMSANIYNSYMEIGNQELKVGANYYIKSEKATSYGYIIAIKEVGKE